MVWSVTESCGMMHEYGRDVRRKIFKRKGLMLDSKGPEGSEIKLFPFISNSES